MDCRLVCISRSLGAGGEEVGRRIAEAFGFRYADEEIIMRAAEQAGVSPETVAEAERTPGLIVRILESIGRNPIAPEAWAAQAVMVSELPQSYEGLIVRVIREIAAEGRAVIVAHGASIPLAGTPGLLRVLVTGSAATRATRLVREAGLSEAEAAKSVRQSDGERKDFLRRFYDVSEELPTHYDIVVNTDVVTPAQAAAAVAAAVRG